MLDGKDLMRLYVQRCVALPPFSLGSISAGCGAPTRIITSAVLRLSLAVLLAGGASVVLADAASLGDSLGGKLVASGLPMLLAPITSFGRKAWDCKPELAASTPHVDEAKLPL